MAVRFPTRPLVSRSECKTLTVAERKKKGMETRAKNMQSGCEVCPIALAY